MNILSTLREQFSSEILGQVSQRTGESPEAAKSALETSLQALLGTAAAKAASPEGAAGLFNLLKEKAPQGGWPASGGSLLGNLSGDGQGAGSSLVNMLLGSKLGMVRDFISSRSGIRTESAAALLGTAGHLLMGLMGRQVAMQGLSASGFGQWLRSQIPHLQRFVPPELSGLLGIGNLLSSDKSAAPATASAPLGGTMGEPVVRTGTSSESRILRYALIPLALLLGIVFIVHRLHRTASVGATGDDTLSMRATSAGVASNVELARVDVSNVADRLRTAIANSDGTPTDLQGMNFDTAGNLSSVSTAALASLGNLLKDSPGVRATITAYGRTAEEAATRANAIRSALVKTGIPGDKVGIQSEIGETMPKISFTK